MPFKRYVEIGRVALVNYGSDYGKLVVIVDVLDHNRALVDAPDMVRSQMNFKRLSLTDIKIDIKRVPKKKELLAAMEAADVKKKWESSSWGRKLIVQKKRASLNDFDRFKLMLAKIKNGKLEQIGNIGLQLVWCFLHLLVSVFYLIKEIANFFESYIISTTGMCPVNPAKINYLGVVIESEEALKSSSVVELLSWLYAIGVNHICLYDEQGVMKRSQKAIAEKFENVKILEKGSDNDKLVSEKCMTLEFASSSDGKEAVVKAANVLLEKYMELEDSDEDQRERIFTEAQMTDTLKAIGCNGTEPDLMLVYGPARCHLGFPAWRIRYTEIVHMGSLKSMRYGSLVKAIYRFTTVRQNYGR